jgi:hypothetical protein
MLGFNNVSASSTGHGANGNTLMTQSSRVSSELCRGQISDAEARNVSYPLIDRSNFWR